MVPPLNKTLSRCSNHDCVYFLGEADITTGRIAALLLYCYRLIEKLLHSKTMLALVATVATVGVIGLASIILYKVFIKIDFFKWLVKKGGWVCECTDVCSSA